MAGIPPFRAKDTGRRLPPSGGSLNWFFTPWRAKDTASGGSLYQPASIDLRMTTNRCRSSMISCRSSFVGTAGPSSLSTSA